MVKKKLSISLGFLLIFYAVSAFSWHITPSKSSSKLLAPLSGQQQRLSGPIIISQHHPGTARRMITSMRLNPRYDDVPLQDRLLSAAPYILPIMDGLTYGRFLAFYAPFVFAPIYTVLNPLLSIYKASPFMNLAIYLLIVYIGRSSQLSRFVRFNFQQSIILDVALVIPSILTSILREQAAPVWIQEPVTNTLFFVLLASLTYVFAALVRGEKPNQIPIISEAAEMSVGPF